LNSFCGYDAYEYPPGEPDPEIIRNDLVDQAVREDKSLGNSISLNTGILIGMEMESPLFVVPDTLTAPPSRYLVKDRDGSILFITGLGDENPEETAIKWAIKKGGWMAGLIAGGRFPSYRDERTVLLKFGVDRPLYIVLDGYGDRYLVVDDDNSVLFLTDLGDPEPEQTATLAAMKLGGWLKGAVKSTQP